MRVRLRPPLTVLLAVALSGIPAMASPARGIPAPLGVVLFAKNVDGKIDVTLSGATIYDGDRLRTESTGALRARLLGLQVYLGPSAAVDVHETFEGFSADLIYGTFVVSSIAGQSFRLLAEGAIIRPATTQATVLEVTKVSSRELLITANRSPVQVSMDDEVRTVEAGESYRMLIQPVDSSLNDRSGNPPQDKGGHPPEGPPTGPTPLPHPTARNRDLWIAVPAIGAVVGIVIWRAVVSPADP